MDAELVSFRIDATLLNEATDVCASLGLELSDYLRACVTRLVQESSKPPPVPTIADREGFIAQAGERLAERIEEGRFKVLAACPSMTFCIWMVRCHSRATTSLKVQAALVVQTDWLVGRRTLANLDVGRSWRGKRLAIPS